MKNHTGINLLFLFLFVQSLLYSQNFFRPVEELPGKHRGRVNSIAVNEMGRIISAGEDGFMEIWNNNEAIERFQLSHYGIRSMALRPGTSQLSVLESDGLGLFRVSAWDYETKENLFSIRFMDPVTYINYSAGGSFLIAAGSGRSGLIIIHSQTGEVLDSPPGILGTVSLAATGRAERNMVTYISSGIISYWDLETGNLLQQFSTLPALQSPILFGNNRFLAAFDSQGLAVIDAATGQLLSRDSLIRGGIIFSHDPAASEFISIVPSGNSQMIYRMGIDNTGRITRLSQRLVPSPNLTAAASADGDTFFLGTSEGELWLSLRSGARRLTYGEPLALNDIAVSSRTIAILTENHRLGFIPLDYNLILQSTSLRGGNTLLFQDFSSEGFNTLISDPGENSEYCSFLAWQRNSNFAPPLLVNYHWDVLQEYGNYIYSFHTYNSPLFNNLPLRLPLRSASLYNGKIMFLDNTGTVTIYNRDTGVMDFTYNASGSMDADFIDQDNIILGRIASMGSAPFMTMNIITGETIQLNLNGLIGMQVYRGRSGNIYGTMINQIQGNVQTSVVKMDLVNPNISERILDYHGEDSSVSIAESNGNLASSLGGGSAILRGENQTDLSYLERSAGLPIKILDGGLYFIVLDSEGNITWHDNNTGKLLALFRLNRDSWVLEVHTDYGINIVHGRTGLM